MQTRDDFLVWLISALINYSIFLCVSLSINEYEWIHTSKANQIEWEWERRVKKKKKDEEKKVLELEIKRWRRCAARDAQEISLIQALQVESAHDARVDVCDIIKIK